MGPSPSVDNAVSYTSLLRLIKSRQIDVTSMVELYLTLSSTPQCTHTRADVQYSGIVVKQRNHFLFLILAKKKL